MRGLIDAVTEWYPGGNPTYLAYAPALTPANYAEGNRVLLQQVPTLEQGGFIVPAKSPEAVARLEMAGGEFCVNATRAFAAALLRDAAGDGRYRTCAKYQRLRRIAPQQFRVPVEVSGAPELLWAAVTGHGDAWVVALELPRLEARIDSTSIAMDGVPLPVRVVRLPGITHVLVDPRLPLPSSQEDRAVLAPKIVAELNLSSEPAVGLLWENRSAEGLRLDPLIWVRATGTCIYETACGSGTLALALITAEGLPQWQGAVMQPSGSAFQVALERGGAGLEEIAAIVEGEVLYRRELGL